MFLRGTATHPGFGASPGSSIQLAEGALVLLFKQVVLVYMMSIPAYEVEGRFLQPAL
jgi:hypothetical protein